jgi:type II secretory pathway component GspD/PulD (secretin)
VKHLVISASLLLLLLCGPSVGAEKDTNTAKTAAEPESAPAAAGSADKKKEKKEEEIIFRVYPLENEISRASLARLKTKVGSNGRVIYKSADKKLLVLATEEQHLQIALLVARLDEPVRNVRVVVTFRGAKKKKTGGASVSGSGKVKVTRQGKNYRFKITPQVKNDLVTESGSLKSMPLTVADGEEGRLSVSSEVPFYDWLTEYGRRSGDIGVDRKDIVKAAGAYLVVRPQTSPGGQTVTVSLIPELREVKKDGKISRLRYTSVSTRVTVANGASINIGGLIRDKVFYRKFLAGVDSSEEPRNLTISLGATVVDAKGRPVRSRTQQ